MTKTTIATTKMLLTLLLINIVMVYVNAADCSNPIVPNLYPVNGTMCWSPIEIVILNPGDFDSITVTPEILVLPAITYIYLVFDAPGTYQLTTTYAGGACTQSQTLVINMPQVNFTQPQCNYQYTTVQLSGLDGVYNGPKNATVFGSGGMRYPFQGLSCPGQFNIIPANNTFQPAIKSQPSLCNIPSGSILIMNSGEFQEITLLIDGVNTTVTNYNNVYNDSNPIQFNNLLGSSGGKTFSIYAKSQQCGTNYQIVPGTLYSTSPSFNLVQTNLPCNTTHTNIKVTTTTTGVNTVTINGISFSSLPVDYDFPIGTLSLTYNENQCGYTQTYTLQSSPAPISYNLDPPLLSFTQSTALMTVSYLGNLSDIVITSAKNGVLSQFNNTNGQITISYDDKYTISTQCYTQQVSIDLERVKPVYHYTKSGDFCMDQIDIVVDNYALFESLWITDGKTTTQPDQGTGKFSNLYHSKWTLVAHEIGAPNSINTTIDLPAGDPFEVPLEHFKVVKENVTRIPNSCVNSVPGVGYAEIWVTYKNQPSTRPTVYPNYRPLSSPSLYFYHPLCPSSGVYAGIWSPGWNISGTTYQITQPAQCKQSFATVHFSGMPMYFTRIAFEKYNAWPAIPITISNNAFDVYLPTGRNDLVLVYNNAGYQCVEYVSIDIPYVDQTKVFTVSTITKQSPSNCNVNSAKIAISNWGEFSNYSIAQGSYDGSGVFSSPSTFSNSINFTHPTCGFGRVDGIKVETDTSNSGISVLPFTQSTCDYALGFGDGSVKVYLSIGGFDQTPLINSIFRPLLQVQLQTSSIKNILSGVGSGDQFIQVNAGTSCIFTSNFSLSANAPYPLFEATLVPAYPGQKNGYIQTRKLHNVKTEKNLMQFNGYYYADTTNTQIVGIENKKLTIDLSFNYGLFCKFTQTFSLFNDSFPKPDYIIRPTDECGSLNMIIEIPIDDFARFQLNLFSTTSQTYVPVDQTTNNTYTVVPGNYILYYSDRYSLTTSSIPITVSFTSSDSVQLPFTADIIANESCSGMRDGQIMVSGFPVGSFISMVDADGNFQRSTIENDGFYNYFIFSGLTSRKDYTIIISSTKCTQRSAVIKVPSNEPRVVVNHVQQYCSSQNTTFATITLSTFPFGLNATYSLDGNPINANNTNSNGEIVIDSLVPGQYELNADIQGDVCSSFITQYVTIKNNTFTLTTLEKQDCEQLAYAVDNPNNLASMKQYGTQLFAQVINFYNTSINYNQTLFNKTSMIINEAIKLTLPAGNYTIWVQDASPAGGCTIYSKAERIEIPKCLPPPPNTTSPPNTSTTTTATTGEVSLSVLTHSPTISLISIIILIISFIYI